MGREIHFFQTLNHLVSDSTRGSGNRNVYLFLSHVNFLPTIICSIKTKTGAQ
jgi:hypothetical protein